MMMRDKWINSIAFLLIGFSIVIVALLYLTDRSLWIDEAMLAYSFTERNLTNLVDSPFALNQSAPVLYLYLVKLITMIFKTSVFSLRIFSFSAYLISLYLIYLIARDLFKLKYPLLVVAFCANMRILIYYANEFKPYMSDVMVVLLVLYLYHRYVINKLKLYQLIMIYMLFIWLSNPALFFIGGVLAYEFFNSLYHKDHQRSKQVIVGGVLVLVSFVSYYFFWLKTTANDPYMISFWAYHRFPLFLTDFGDLYKLLRLSGALIADMSYNIVLISILIIAGGIISIYQKSRYHIIIYLSIFLTLLASYLGKYPFYDRLMLFIYPILAIYIFIALEALLKRSKRTILVIVIFILVFVSNYKSYLYLFETNRYVAKNEIKQLISYVDKNIQQDEVLYVYYRALPAYTFIKGHDEHSIGEYQDNVIFGKGSLPDDLFGIDSTDLDKILEYDKCYILIAHHEDEFIDDQLTLLKTYGQVELIIEAQNTPLYYFKADQ